MVATAGTIPWVLDYLTYAMTWFSQIDFLQAGRYSHLYHWYCFDFFKNSFWRVRWLPTGCEFPEGRQDSSRNTEFTQHRMVTKYILRQPLFKLCWFNVSCVTYAVILTIWPKSLIKQMIRTVQIEINSPKLLPFSFQNSNIMKNKKGGHCSRLKEIKAMWHLKEISG